MRNSFHISEKTKNDFHLIKTQISHLNSLSMEHRSYYAPTAYINTFSRGRLQYCQDNIELTKPNMRNDLFDI